MSKFPDPFVNDYRSKYKEKNRRGVSKHSSFQPFFNSDEFYNPVYTESVTSVEQQLEILSIGNAQNATHALNSLSFLLENPFKNLSNNDTVFIGICGNLLCFSLPSIQQMVQSLGWNIEHFSKKNEERYSHILLGVRPNEKELSLCTHLGLPMTVEYHLKRYFERYSIQQIQTNVLVVKEFVNSVLQQSNQQNNLSIDEITTSLFALELFGSSKAIRLQAREYLKEYLNDEQKDALRLHWFKQPTKYSYNPKFFHDVSAFLETVSMNGQLFQETAYQLTTIPTTQELLASKQASMVVASLVEEQFRPEFFETISGIVMKNIDALTLKLENLKSLNELQYLSVQHCEIFSFTASTLLSVRYLSLLHCEISEQDFCTLIESLPKLQFLLISDVKIVPSKNSPMYRMKFPQCCSISISQLEYEFSNDLYKKITKIRSLKKLSLENFNLNSSLHSIQFSSNTSLEEVTIAGFALSNITEIGVVSKKLHSLALRSTGIQLLDGIEKLPSLKSLQITDEVLTNVAPLLHCKQLHSISLRSCSLEFFPNELLECKLLEVIDISSNSIQEVQLKGKKFSRLQRLICSNNQISLIEIQNFPKLEFVYISKNELRKLPKFAQQRTNKDITIDLVDNPLEENEIEKTMKLIREGWRILCSLPKNHEEIVE
ncbi:MAG: hypothetical protein JNL36_08295 [Candidatus Kapabacteria bacterium]|nr:hypothetical protein [Candidatus Kapabacteria bacterium]